MLQEEVITRNGIALDPKMDGVTHINVFTRGNTLVGRECSNLRHAPTDNPSLILLKGAYGEEMKPIGKFDCLEGFWWWLSTGMTEEYFRTCSGFDARRHGSSLTKIPRASFKHEIRYAIALKLKTYPDMLSRLLNSILPLAHYYVFGKPGAPQKVRPADRSMWVIHFLEEIREGGEEVINKILT